MLHRIILYLLLELWGLNANIIMLCGIYCCFSWCSFIGKSKHKFHKNIFSSQKLNKNPIFRFMLKSLGQWTSPSLKPRKIIPSTLTVVPAKPPPPENRGQGESVSLQEEEGYVNFLIFIDLYTFLILLYNI